METTVYQRIKQYFDDNQISLNGLAKTLNMNKSTVLRQVKGEQTLSSTLVENFLNAYPDVSAEWLMRGEGMSGSMEGNVLGDSTRFSPLLDLRIQVRGTYQLVEYQFSCSLRQPTDCFF